MSARKRRTKGDGSLFLRKDGMWVGSVEAGWKPDGTRARKYVSSRSQAEALAKLRKARSAVERTGTVPTRTTTVEKWLDLWLTHIANVKPTTTGNYRSVIDCYLVPKLGKTRLDKLAPAHIRDMQTWITAPKPAGLGLSASTAHRAHRVLRKALNDAVTEGVLVESPMRAVSAPTVGKVDAPMLTVAQARDLIRTTWEDWWGPRWTAALLTGARQGELLGLEWSRVNLAARTIDVSWQLQRLGFRHGCQGRCGVKRPGSCPERELDVKPEFLVRQLDGGLCLTQPKTSMSTRLIPIADPMAAALQVQIERARGLPNPHGLVFHRQDGRPQDPSLDNSGWHAALDAAGLPSVKLHAARHTTATMLLVAGVDQTVVQAVLGHSTVSMTRAYQHVDMSLSLAAMRSMSDLLGAMPAGPALGVTPGTSALPPSA